MPINRTERTEEESLIYAIEMLGQYGTSADVPVLKNFVANKTMKAPAAKAIQQLEIKQKIKRLVPLQYTLK